MTKNEVPKDLSLILNDALMYSNPCIRVKIRPRIIQPIVLATDSFIHLEIINPWDKVKRTPLLNKRMVFNKGTPRTARGVNPLGGQIPPNSIVGDKENSKNLQKKEKKNNTSETINRINPFFIPTVTLSL